MTSNGGKVSDSNESRYQVHEEIKQKLTRLDGIVVFVIMALLMFSAWARGGTLRQYLAPYSWLAVFVFLIFLLAPYLRGTSHSHRCLLVSQQVRRVFRDPMFFIGIAFLCLLYIQWWNSGKVRIFEQIEGGGQNVTFSPPYIDWLPGAVDTTGSWDMIVWFFPAFVALLIVRHAFSNSRMIRLLFWGMIINASLLAAFGLVAPILAKNYPLWLTSILPRQTVHYFSTFGYPNHAGSYFILHLGLTCGLLFYYFTNRKEETRLRPNVRILFLIALLLFSAIHLTRSRYAILFAWVMAVLFTACLLRLLVRENPYARKTAVYAIIITGFLVTGSLALYISAKDDVRSKLSTLASPGKFIRDQFDMKFWQVKSAAEIWRDYPLFGIGGESYREYVMQYVKDPKRRSFAIYNRGMANVHNDFMQFLCEFGAVGVGLLVAVLVLLTVKIIRSRQWKNGFVLFGLLGLSGVLIHSLIDLPFRSPPIIIAFTVVLAAYGMFCQPGENTYRDYGPVTRFVTRFINFYSILFLFIVLVLWLAFTPLRQKASADIIRSVEREYNAKLIVPYYDNVTPAKSQNASPILLRSLWWAKCLYADHKNLHLLSAKVNFDLYREFKPRDEKKAGKFLKDAFRSSLSARQFTTYGDIQFVKLHAAILDAMGYHLEESWCLKNLGKIHRDDIRVNLLLREYYYRRPYLIR